MYPGTSHPVMYKISISLSLRNTHAHTHTLRIWTHWSYIAQLRPSHKPHDKPVCQDYNFSELRSERTHLLRTKSWATRHCRLPGMGLPAGLLEFLGPVGWGAAVLVGVVIFIQVVKKNREEKRSISPGTHKCFGDERTRLKEEKSNEASGRTGNSRKKRVEPCRHDEHEDDVIKGYGLGHVHKYKE